MRTDIHLSRRGMGAKRGQNTDRRMRNSSGHAQEMEALTGAVD